LSSVVPVSTPTYALGATQAKTQFEKSAVVYTGSDSQILTICPDIAFSLTNSDTTAIDGSIFTF